jgi:dihydrofolate reductase
MDRSHAHVPARLGSSGGQTGIDNDFVARGFADIGAWILGRNMFGPIRGPWRDQTWRGWWGENPPYHTAVFVLTRHARPSVTMQGGTTFHFVTDGITRHPNTRARPPVARTSGWAAEWPRFVNTSKRG